MAAARFNAFLWNRISQGYDRVVKDAPPHESWRAWRRGSSRDTKPALYRSTPTPSPAAWRGAASSVAEEQAQSQPQPGAQSQSQLPSGLPRDVQGVNIELEGQGPRTEGPVAATERTSERAAGAAAGAAAGPAGCRAGNDSNRDEEDDDDDAMDYEEVLTVVLIGPPHTQVVDLPFPTTSAQPPESVSRGASTSSPSPGRLIPHRVLLKFKAPENVKLAVVHCTFSSVEDVGKDFSKHVSSLMVVRLNLFRRNGTERCIHH